MGLKKRIVLINYTLTAGGTERYISSLANNLCSEGYEVNVLLLKRDKIFYNLNNNVALFQPHSIYPNSRISKFFYYLRIMFYLRSTIRSIQPSLILNTAFPIFIFSSLLRIKNPIVLAVRCDPRDVKLVEGLKFPLLIRRVLYKRSKAIIAQTSYASKILISQFPSIPNVTVPNFLGPKIIPNNNRDNIIISAGRLKKSKGFDYLIRSFSRVTADNWKLVIVGEGPESNNLIRLVKQLNLEQRVSILSYHPNLLELYSRSKIFAFTSLTEGYPNVLLEAMATPLACISFDIIAGPGDIISNNVNGFLVEPKNITEFAEKLNQLIHDEKLQRKFMDAAIGVRNSNSWNTLKEKYIELLDTYAVND